MALSLQLSDGSFPLFEYLLHEQQLLSLLDSLRNLDLLLFLSHSLHLFGLFALADSVEQLGPCGVLHHVAQVLGQFCSHRLIGELVFQSYDIDLFDDELLAILGLLFVFI